MASKSKVYFFFDGVTLSLRNRGKLKKVIELMFKKEKVSLDRLNYIFCSDKKLLSINNQYLNHDYYTDIITFTLSEKGDSIIGEAYISTDRIRDNARTNNTPVYKEFQRVILHGALHLCGYNDKSRQEKNKIREREDFYLSRL